MRSVRGLVILSLVAGVALSGCARKEVEPKLLNIKSRDGTPDEFLIQPTKPLETPEDFTALPQPTPGGTNRVDINPSAEAVAALGGNPDRVLPGAGIPRADAGLLTHTGRFGVAQDIRPILAEEDLEFRRGKNGRPLERLFGTNVYYRAYEPQSLDQHQELDRWRARGVRTPAAPPEELLYLE